MLSRRRATRVKVALPLTVRQSGTRDAHHRRPPLTRRCEIDCIQCLMPISPIADVEVTPIMTPDLHCWSLNVASQLVGRDPFELRALRDHDAEVPERYRRNPQGARA